MKNKKKRLADIRHSFFNDLDEGRLTTNLPDAIRRMRKTIGVTQVEYAKIAGIAPRVLIDLERGVGNPTLKTLEKIVSPFGLQIGLVRRR